MDVYRRYRHWRHRALHHARCRPHGLIATGILGIIGSFVGGFLVRMFSKAPADNSKIQPAGIIMSIVGALIVLFIYNRLVA
jgi:uncharacterized membrane protein YeaQ/YmgE (transglycosylase-associated protein family)